MKEYEIWVDGYEVTGNSSPPTMFGTAFGVDFRDACDNFFADREDKRYYNRASLTYWACSLAPSKEKL